MNPENNGLKLLPDTLKNMNYTYSAKVSNKRVFAKSDQFIENDEKYAISCGVCGSNKIKLIYQEYNAHNCGKDGTWEFLCLKCKNYTILFLND